MRNQAIGLRKVHLVECLSDAQANNQVERECGTRQKMDREHNVRMWYLIKKTAIDLSSPAVLKVQTVRNGRKSTYTKQEDIKAVL